MGPFWRGRKRGGARVELPEWAWMFDDARKFHRFMDLVSGYFDGLGCEYDIDDGMVQSGDPGFNGMRMGLTNLAQTCLGMAASEWPDAVRAHFECLRNTEREADAIERVKGDFSKVAPLLGVRLYPPEALGEMFETMVSREDLPGLASVLCLNLPSSIRMLRRDEADAWGVSDDELFMTALTNLDSFTDARVERVELPGGGSIWIVEGPSIFNASLVLRPERLSAWLGRHGAFVSVPVRNCVFAAPFDGPEGTRHCAGVMQITASTANEGPGTICSSVWWTDGKRWIRIPYEIGRKGGITVMPPTEFNEILARLCETWKAEERMKAPRS